MTPYFSGNQLGITALAPTEFDQGYLAGRQTERAALAREQPRVTLAHYTLDRRTRIIEFPGGAARLTRSQYLIVELLMTGRCVSLGLIIETLWPLGDESVDTSRLVWTHMSLLRRKLPAGLLLSRHGQGWLLNLDLTP